MPLSRFGPGLLKVLDEILSVLTRAGFTNKQAVDAIAALISITFGLADHRHVPRPQRR